MNPHRKLWLILVSCLVLSGIGATAVAMGYLGPVHIWRGPVGQDSTTSPTQESTAQLVDGERDTLSLPADLARKMGLQTAAVQKSTHMRPLVLAGSLALEPNRLTRVHTRFGGEVVELGMVQEPTLSLSSAEPRQVRVGDRVEKNQLVAVIWSKDLGEKKSELVDALSQLRLDEARLEKLEEGYQKQAIPEQSVRQARRDVEADLIAVARAERTLRVWRVPEAEIDSVKEEADRIRARKGKRDVTKEKDWARVEVRAPFAGIVLERNIALGDVVDTAMDLFKIADLSRLCVWAHAYENQLPDLQKLPRPILWTVRLKADPDAAPLPGAVDMIGSIVDPVQHTCVLRGHVDNDQEKLRAGQFVTATVDLPPPPDEVTIPIAALVEDGQKSVVMVQTSPGQSRFTCRVVTVTRRGADVAYLKLNGGSGSSALTPGDQVVTVGALALKAKLDELKSATR